MTITCNIKHDESLGTQKLLWTGYPRKHSIPIELNMIYPTTNPKYRSGAEWGVTTRNAFQ